MPKPLKDIVELPLSACPLCGMKELSVKPGKRGLLGKKPDAIACGNCATVFEIDLVFQHTGALHFVSVPEPYSFFGERFQGWMKVADAAHLGELIRTNSPETLSFLSGWRRYLWRVRLVVGATGPAGEMETKFQWETEDAAKKLLAQIRQMQKELRQVKREMDLDLKGIRAKYGRTAEATKAKRKALLPYERVALAIDSTLLQMDQTKLKIQGWIEEQKQGG